MFSISDLQIYQLEVKRHTREHDLAAMEQNFCTSVPIFNEDVYTSLSYTLHNIQYLPESVSENFVFEKVWNLVKSFFF